MSPTRINTILKEPTQLQRDDTAPWEQLPYKCRIDWTREVTEILKQRSLEYIRSQPDDITYYTVSGHGWRRQLYTRKEK